MSARRFCVMVTRFVGAHPRSVWVHQTDPSGYAFDAHRASRYEAGVARQVAADAMRVEGVEAVMLVPVAS